MDPHQGLGFVETAAKIGYGCGIESNEPPVSKVGLGEQLLAGERKLRIILKFEQKLQTRFQIIEILGKSQKIITDNELSQIRSSIKNVEAGQTQAPTCVAGRASHSRAIEVEGTVKFAPVDRRRCFFEMMLPN